MKKSVISLSTTALALLSLSLPLLAMEVEQNTIMLPKVKAKEIDTRESDFAIIQKFRENGDLDKLQKIKVIKPSAGKQTDAIILLKQQGPDKTRGPLAIKVFNDISAWGEEKKQIDQMNITIDSVNSFYNKNHDGLPLPHIIKSRSGVYLTEDEHNKEGYEGSYIGGILMDRAKGKTLLEIINELPELSGDDMCASGKDV